ncbi:hypothetical protein GGF31_008330 [Allomyces arbusculus]|nr:hypothetical protein GGF31_008330 [Allomyces arbusculus]
MTDLGAPIAAAVAAASSTGSSSTTMPAPNNTSFPDPTIEDVPDSGENALQGQHDVTIEPSAGDDAMDLDDPPPPTTTAPPRRKRRPRRGDLLLFVVHGMGRQDWLPRNVESLRSSVTAILADSAAAAVVDRDADADVDNDVAQDATSHDAHLPFRRAAGPLRHVGRVDLVPIEYHSVLHATTKAAIDRIRLPSCPAMRTVIDEFVVDPLYYFTPFHGQFVRNEVVRQLNAKYAEYMAAHPNFRGHVALLAHSQGGIVMWDLLNAKVADGVSPVAIPLAFPLTHVFTMGSPIANVVVLRGHDQGLPRNAEAARDDLASSLALPSADVADDGLRAHYAHPTTQFFSLFHPLDPIAYRIEPLFDAHLASVPPVPVPIYVPPAVSASADRSAAGALILRQWNDRWRRAILASLAGALPTLAPILRAPQAFSNPLPHLSRHMRSIVDALVAAGAAGAEAAAAVVAAAMRAEQQQAQQGQDEAVQHDGYSSDDEQGQDEDEDENNEVDELANGDAPLLARRRRARRRPVSPAVIAGITDRQDSGAAVDGSDATDGMDVDPNIVTSPLSPSSWRLPFLSSSRTAAVGPADPSAKDTDAVSADSDGEEDNDETPLHPPSPVLTQPGLTTPVNATPRRKRRRVESIPTSTTTTTTTLTTITGPCLVVTPAGMVQPTATVAASASAAAAATVRAGHAVATAAVSVAASSATAVAAWAPRNPRAAASLWAMLRGDAAAATAPAQDGADAAPSAALDLDADVDRVVPPTASADTSVPQTADPEEATIEVEDEDGARESSQLLPGRARRIPPVAREPSALSLDEDAPAARTSSSFAAARRTIPPRRIVPASSTVTSRRIRTEGDYVVNQLRSMFSARGSATTAPPPPPLSRTPSVSAATTTAPTTATVPVPLDVIPSPPVSDPEEVEAKPDAEVAAAQDAAAAKAAIARLPRGQRLDYVLQVPPARGILPSNEYLGGLRAHFNYWGSKDVMWFVLRTLDGVLAEALGFEDASEDEDEDEVAVAEPGEGAGKDDVVADAIVAEAEEAVGGPTGLAPSEGLEPFVEGIVLE